MGTSLIRNCFKFGFIFSCLLLTACATHYPETDFGEEKRVVPSKKNNVTAVNPKTYEQAYQEYYDRAIRGDAIAQNNLGHMYSDGRGVEQNNAQAIEWFTKAAQQGNTAAIVNLGVANLYGRGLAANKKQACKYFQKATTMGNREGKEFYNSYCDL